MLSKEYMAGLFDGEGHVHIHRKHALKCGITNTYKPVLDEINERYGGKIHLKQKTNLTKLDVWELQLWSVMARSFLGDIEPYLIIKKDKTKWCLANAKYAKPRKYEHS